MSALPSITEPAAGPAEAEVGALYEQYSGRILGYCLRRLPSREEAEDAVQHTFMNAFRGLRQGVVPRSEAAWLFKIAENVCRERRRSAWRRNQLELVQDPDGMAGLAAAPQRREGRGDRGAGRRSRGRDARGAARAPVRVACDPSARGCAGHCRADA